MAYDKLVQREMRQKGISREQINPLNAVLYGAAAGYAVSPANQSSISAQFIGPFLAVGSDIPHRHDQISDAN